MRLLTLGLVRRWLRPRAGVRAAGTTPVAEALPHQHQESDDYLEAVGPWAEADEAQRALLAAARRSMRVLPDFVSEAQEAALAAELEPYLKKMRYEYDHWDDAIHGYKETERKTWTPENAAVLARVREVAFPPGSDAGEPQPHVHVLDLAPTGHIKPHVDATRYCGAVIAGLCLYSPAVMRLSPAAPGAAEGAGRGAAAAGGYEGGAGGRPDLALLALLPRRALYIMSGAARYSFTHAVEGGALSMFRGQRVPRARRLALITRSAPPPAPPPAASGPECGSVAPDGPFFKVEL